MLYGVELDGSLDTVDNFIIEHLSEEMPLEEAMGSTKWRSAKNSFSLGYNFEGMWFKIEATNPTNSTLEYYLEFSEPFSENTNFYIFEEGGYREVLGGLSIPIDKRSVYSQHPSVLLHFNPKETKSIYIYYKSRFTSYGSFSFYTPTGWWHKRIIHIAFFVFYFGGIFGMILYNLFIYFSLKERIYLYYTAYALFFSMWVWLYSGYSLYLVDGWLHYILHFSTPFAFVFFALFTRDVLEIRQRSSPIAFKVIKIFVFLLLYCSLLIIFHLEYGYLLANIIGFMLFPAFILLAIFAIKREVNQAKFYLVSFLIFVILMTLVSNLALGVASFNILTKYAFVVGSFLEISLFSLLLGVRFHMLKEKKIGSQRRLIYIKNEKSVYLECKIKLRTKQLSVANEKLSEMIKEREMLLREIHHRVKNNLQVITALLWFQSKRSTSLEVKSALEESTDRILSISRIHELLYSVENVQKISSEAYFANLTSKLAQASGLKNDAIFLNIENRILSTDEGISLGIILNEAFTNAIKHFKDKKSHLILWIDFYSKNGRIIFLVRDNGDGFSIEEKEEKDRLGIKLIKQMASKLNDCRVVFENREGAIMRLEYSI